MDKRYYKIYRGLKRLGDGMRSLASSQRQLAKDVNLFYEEDSPMKSHAVEYESISENIAGASDRSMSDRFALEVLTPTCQILDKIENVRKVIDDRWTLQLEYDYYRNKLKRLQTDKKGPDHERIARNEEKVAQCKIRYEEANQKCIEECAYLSENRYKMWDYSFVQMMACQSEFYETAQRAAAPLRKLMQVTPEKFILGVDDAEQSVNEAVMNQGPRIAPDRRDQPGVLGALMGKKAPNPVNLSIKHKHIEAVAEAAGFKDELSAHGLDLEERSHANEKRCKALYDYEAAEEGEVSFYEGDIIYVSNEDPSGWSTGSREDDGRSGLFPATYVTPAPLMEVKKAPIRPARASTMVGIPPPPPMEADQDTSTPPPPPIPAAPASNPMMAEMASRMAARKGSADLDKLPAVPAAPLVREAPPEDKTPVRAMPTPPMKKAPVPATTVSSPQPTAVAAGSPSVRASPAATRSPVAPVAAPAATAVAACGTCGCNTFVAHSFKKGQCNNCFHQH
eukprot:TRINITY_DN14636_c0_g1_i1.p1 TRINITY_DN14636_c0_g1~~TRINITY_DN14636_c0_g1_i1.p1  ORF type:complete len:567 (-),score=117.75 TRINITY_DN14636_c0_g1_i1:142-1665(-)